VPVILVAQPPTLLHGSNRRAAQSSPRSDNLCDANVLWPPKLEHAVQRRDSNSHISHLAAFGPRAQCVTDHSLVAADVGLHQGTPIVTGCPLPAHAAALGNQLQVPVALRRCGLCRCAWHRVRTWRHNDRRIRMTLADLTVDIVPIVRPIASKRRNRARNLLQQGTDLRAVIDIMLVSSVAMICPVSASTPMWSFRQHRRALAAYFSTSHSPGPQSLRPVLSTSRWTGSLPGRGRDTGNVSPRRLIVEWSGAARSRPSS
jgi:hypothetical protein